ncbi:MAG: DNA polymerase I [Candidatus Gastranaerophilales bacterium]|nr:DNA polymerase I [Candidatus Gastranaerophilales bacterium]
MSKTLVLIDGHALAFRQFYALERTSMKNSDNQPTWAVYGFFKAIFDLLSEIRPDSIAVTFDVSHHTFRTEMYQDYKANRETMPVSLGTQLDFICQGLQAFDIPIYTREGFEADDVIGTISARAAKLGHRTLILTGDQDAFQLIDKDGLIKVLIPSKGGLIEYNRDKVYEKLGVYPEQVIDYKGLRGDTSDNIPGIRGIGEKTAQKLLAEFKTLDNVLANCDNIQQNSLREKICSGSQMAKLSQKLATIIRDVDIEFDFDRAEVVLPDINKVSKFLREMQFYSFIKNINKILTSFNPEAAKDKDFSHTPLLETKTETAGETGQLGLFTQAIKETVEDTGFSCKVLNSAEEVSNLAAEIKTKQSIALNVCADKSQIYGIAVSFGENYFVKADFIDILKPVIEDKNCKKVFYDAKRNCRILRENGINLEGIEYDVLLASYVKDPNRSHSIESQALDFLNHIMGEKSELNSELLHSACTYACDETYSIFNLAKYWKGNLTVQEQKIVREIELPLTTVLAKMEYTGVAIDISYLKSLSDYMTDKLAEIEDFIYQLAGGPFNINSPKQVADVLYDRLGIRSKKRKRSTSAEILEELAGEYEICDYILQHRKFSKLRSTYTDALPALISKRDGRIHTTYNQATTVTGRLSSSNPNLQNIPIRTEEGNKIRNAFCPQDRENYVILSADYSQIELRLLAHAADDRHLIEAFNSSVDVHTLTASKVFDVPVEQVTKDMRRKAKAVNFGIVYGQSKYGLAKVLNISNEQAGEFIEKYFDSYPNIKQYMTEKTDFVHEYGYVETLYGRKRYLGAELASANYQIREFAHRAAINQPLQGSAADLIKLAMIKIDKILTEQDFKSKMIMQVHDELVFEVAKDELEKLKSIVVEAMEMEQPFKVPLVVDVNCGATWKE